MKTIKNTPSAENGFVGFEGDEAENICMKGYFMCPDDEQCAIACDGIPECITGGKKCKLDLF